MNDQILFCVLLLLASVCTVVGVIGLRNAIREHLAYRRLDEDGREKYRREQIVLDSDFYLN